jgi:hypothetical protein
MNNQTLTRLVYEELDRNLCQNQMKMILVTIAIALNMNPRKEESANDLCNRLKDRLNRESFIPVEVDRKTI